MRVSRIAAVVLVIVAVLAVVVIPGLTSGTDTPQTTGTRRTTGTPPTTVGIAPVMTFRVVASLATVDYGVSCPAGTDVVDVVVYGVGMDGRDLPDYTATAHGCLTHGADPLASPAWANVLPGLYRAAAQPRTFDEDTLPDEMYRWVDTHPGADLQGPSRADRLSAGHHGCYAAVSGDGTSGLLMCPDAYRIEW